MVPLLMITTRSQAIANGNNWRAQINGVSTGYQTIRDNRDLANRVPLLFIAGDRAGTNIAAGADRFSHANSLDQDIFEVRDDFSFSYDARGRHDFKTGVNEQPGSASVVQSVSTGLDAIGYSGWLMVEQDSTWLAPAEAAAIGGRVLRYAIRELGS